MLHALRCEHKIINPGDYGLSQRQLRLRAEEITNGNWAADAVRTAIQEMTAAVVAAVSPPAALSTGASKLGLTMPHTGQRLVVASARPATQCRPGGSDVSR